MLTKEQSVAALKQAVILIECAIGDLRAISAMNYTGDDNEDRLLDAARYLGEAETEARAALESLRLPAIEFPEIDSTTAGVLSIFAGGNLVESIRASVKILALEDLQRRLRTIQEGISSSMGPVTKG
jgi:hypothetical protein